MIRIIPAKDHLLGTAIAPRYIIRDRDAVYGDFVIRRLFGQ